MGIVRAYQKGTLKTPPSPEVQGVATSMKKSDVEKFASTKHKGLPEKVTEMADPLPKNDKPLKPNQVKQKQKTQPSSSPYLPGKSPIPSEQIKEEESSPNNESESRKNQTPKLTRIGDILGKMKNDPEKRLRQQMKEKDNENKGDVNEDYVKELEDGLVKMDYPTYDEVDELMKKIAKDNGIDTTVLHMAFKTKHLMVPDDWAKKKMFEPVMIPKTPVKEGGWDDVESIVFKHRANQGRNPNPSFSDTVKNSKRNPLKDLKDKLDKPVNNIVKKSKEDKEETKEEYLPEISKANPNKIKPENPYSPKKKLEMVGRSIKDRIKQKAKSLTRTYDEGILPDIILQRKIDLNGDEDKRILSIKGKKKKETQTEGNLRDWFKGSKSKDGKGGWVNVVTGGTCASDEPGEGTPKCVSSKKRASMTKAERLSAQRRKKAADPNQQSKSGAAKPTYVSTDKKKPVKESLLSMISEMSDSKMQRQSDENLDALHKKFSKMDQTSPANQYMTKRIAREQKRRLAQKQKEAKRMSAQNNKPEGAQVIEDFSPILEGGGKIGRQFTMGKIGNQYTRDEYGDPIKKDGSSALKKNEDKNPKDEKITRSEAYSANPAQQAAIAIAKKKKKEDDMVAKKMKKEGVEYINERGKYSAIVDAGVRIGGKKGGRIAQQAEKKVGKAVVTKGRNAVTSAKKGNPKKQVGSGNFEKAGAAIGGTLGGVAGAAIPDGPLMVAGELAGGYVGSKIGGKLGRQVDKMTNNNRPEKKTNDKKTGMRLATEAVNINELKVAKGTNYHKMTYSDYKRTHKDFKSKGTPGKTLPRVSVLDDKTQATVSRPVKFVPKKKVKEEVEQIDEFKRSPAWQRKAGKSESGGLNAKGVASYRAANPGSKLKTAVTTKPSKLKKGSKAANRRKSFCKRMSGMKKKLTSAKTARDPDSRINKALRKWNCSFEPENGEILSETMLSTIKRKVSVLGGGSNKKPATKTTGRDAGAIARKVLKQKQHNKYVNFLDIDEEKKIPKNVKKIAKELDAAVKMHTSQADRLRKAGISEGKKKCGEGEYYCNDMKKCRPIPKGYRVGYGGMLKPENENDESNGKKGGSNGNGNGHGGNGNGNGGNGNGGNGGGE